MSDEDGLLAPLPKGILLVNVGGIFMIVNCPLCAASFRLSSLDSDRKNPFYPLHPMTPVDQIAFRHSCKRQDECPLEQCPVVVARVQDDRAAVISQMERDDPKLIEELRQAYESHLSLMEERKKQIKDREQQQRLEKERQRVLAKKEQLRKQKDIEYAAEIAAFVEISGAAKIKFSVGLAEAVHGSCEELHRRKRDARGALTSDLRHQAKRLRQKERDKQAHWLQDLRAHCEKFEREAALIRAKLRSNLPQNIEGLSQKERWLQVQKIVRAGLVTTLRRRHEQLQKQEHRALRARVSIDQKTHYQRIAPSRSLGDWIDAVVTLKRQE